MHDYSAIKESLSIIESSSRMTKKMVESNPDLEKLLKHLDLYINLMSLELADVESKIQYILILENEKEEIK